MKRLALPTLVLAAGVVAGAVLIALDAVTPTTTVARDRRTSISSNGGPPGGLGAIAAQASSEPDQRVPVQLWTVLAAGGAAGVGLVLFLLRVALGRVKPPPPQDESHH